jgi:hypothetical protein
MYEDSQSSRDQKCLDCGLVFDSSTQLINHKRRFCLNSGYDSLEGLAKIELNGPPLLHSPKFGHKNHLQQYGANSLTKIDQSDPLSASGLEKDMRNIYKYKRQLEGVKKYRHEELADSYSSTISKHNKTGLSHNSLTDSRIEENLKRY